MRTNNGQILYIPKIGQRADFQHPLMKGCVDWWPLTDGGGGIAKDIVGTNDGTQSGGVTWADTELGRAASFDGVDDYLAFGTYSSFFPGPSITGSISTWFKWFSGDVAMMGNQYTINERLYISVYNGKWDIGFGDYLWNSNYTGTLVSAVSGEWTHIVVSISSGVAKLYVNGSETITKTADTSVSLGGQFSAGIYYYDGGPDSNWREPFELQNVRVYTTALSSNQVQQLYTNPWSGLSMPSATRYFFVPQLITASPKLFSVSGSSVSMRSNVGRVSVRAAR